MAVVVMMAVAMVVVASLVAARAWQGWPGGGCSSVLIGKSKRNTEYLMLYTVSTA